MPQIEAIELDGHGPVYDQIKRAVTAQIRSGAWKPGFQTAAKSVQETF